MRARCLTLVAADDNQRLIKSRAKGNDLPTIVSKIVHSDGGVESGLRVATLKQQVTSQQHQIFYVYPFVATCYSLLTIHL